MTIWCNETLMIDSCAVFTHVYGKDRIMNMRRACCIRRRQSWSPLKGSVLGDLHYYVADRRIFSG